MTGNVTAATLNYSTYTQDLTLDQTAGTVSHNGVGGTLSGFTTVNANPGQTNTVSGTGATYTLDNTTADKGTGGGLTWTAFQNITDATGTVNIQASGALSGLATVQALNYGTFGSDVTVGLTGANAGSITGITGVLRGGEHAHGERGAEQHDGRDGADVSAGRDDGGHGQLEQRDVDGL